MHINATEESAKNIRVVLLDGKPVPMCYEANEEEGWVISWIPEVEKVELGGQIVELQSSNDFVQVKRTGKVQIIFNK